MVKIGHLHFGAGRFGLGFVCWLAHQANLNTVLLNRSGNSDTNQPNKSLTSTERNDLLTETGEVFMETLSEMPDITRYKINNYITYDENTDFDIERFQSIENHTEYLITFSFGNQAAYEGAFRILSKFLETNSNQITRIYFVCCENTISTKDMYQLFTKMHPNIPKSIKISPLEAMVDRICTSLTIKEINHRKYLSVQVEPYAKLVLEKTRLTKNLEDKLKEIAEYVEFSKEIEFEKNKKVWILNGAHMLSALNGLYFGFERLNDYLTSTEQCGYPEEELKQILAAELIDVFPSVKSRRQETSEIIRELIDGFVSFLEKTDKGRKYIEEYFDEEKQIAYAEELLKRFEDTSDFIGRILRGFERDNFNNIENNITSFMKEKFIPKVSLNYRHYTNKYGYAPKAVSTSLMRIFQLIANDRFVEER